MRRVALKDIASETGLSISTISRALAGMTCLSAATRERVSEAARRLGYRPDPALARLAAWRWGGEAHVSDGNVLGVISDFDGEFPQYVERRLGGVRERAHQLGYGLDIFFLRDYGNRTAKLAAVIESRGIHGVIVERVNRPGSFDGFPWGNFTAVAMGTGNETLPLATASNDMFQSIRLCFQKARLAGYRRLGLVLLFGGRPTEYDRARAAALFEQSLAVDGEETVPLLDHDVEAGGALTLHMLRGWIEDHRPDVIIGHPILVDMLGELGVRVPRDMGFATPIRSSVLPRWISGATSNLRAVGRLAVEVCHQMLLRPSTTEAGLSVSHIIGPRWFEGHSLSPPKARKTRKQR